MMDDDGHVVVSSIKKKNTYSGYLSLGIKSAPAAYNIPGQIRSLDIVET